MPTSKTMFSSQGWRDDGMMIRADGWWQGVLAKQDDEGMMAGWCGPMADDKRWWMMKGHAGWEGWWQDDGRMMRAEGRMMRACGYMSRMTPGWCIIEADNTQLTMATYKSFPKCALKGGQEAAHQDDTRMIGRMMTRMIKKIMPSKKKTQLSKPASSCLPRMIGPKAGWYDPALGHHPGLTDRPE